MKKYLSLFILGLGAISSPAYAAPKWTKAIGALYLTDYSTTSGSTLEDWPASRAKNVNLDIRTKGNRESIKTKCRDNRANQRVCTAFYYGTIVNETCGFDVTTVLNKIGSSSRRKRMFQEFTITCPSGWAAYALWQGFIVVK